MRLQTAVVCISLFVVAISAAAPPVISQTFNAKVNIRVTDHHGRGTDDGTGVWASSQQGQATVQNFAFNRGTFDTLSLDRYDQGKLYRVYSTNSSRCDVFPVEDKMPNPWSWLQNATYLGPEVFQGKPVAVWELNVRFGTRRLAVWSPALTTPAWFSSNTGERDTFIEYLTFDASINDNSVFTVPSVCQNPYQKPTVNEPDACISSETIIANANIWLSHKVPYNQNGIYMSYREDCSGYVSFTWKSGAPGRSTSEFHEVSHPITKAQLVPGDCMLYASDHVCLFGGWVDAAKTHYWAYEETQPCSTNPNWCGTMKNNVVYPYYYDASDFLPYRYNNFCGK